MLMITANCPACGATYGGPTTSRFITCEYCGTRYALSENELRAMGFVDKDGDGYDDRDVVSSKGARKDSRRRKTSSSSTPMYAFARDACEEFLKDHDGDRDEFRSTQKVLNGLEVKNSDDVYLIHDDTLFKSGKNGFAISREGIYCREMGGKPTFTSWDKFSSGDEPERSDSYIYQGGTPVCYFTGNGGIQRDLERLYEDLWNHATS